MRKGIPKYHLVLGREDLPCHHETDPIVDLAHSMYFLDQYMYQKDQILYHCTTSTMVIRFRGIVHHQIAILDTASEQSIVALDRMHHSVAGFLDNY